MPQHDFDTFKQRLREWKNSHSDEYDAFVAGMNRRDDMGYQTILGMAIALAPEYEKIVSRRINRGPDDDISDVEQIFTERGLAEALTDGSGGGLTASLLGDFEDIRKESIVPAMLCWLYFGQSFKRMVERGEELRRTPEIPYHEKMLVAQTIKMLVDQSIELGLRTKENWAKHLSWMKLADSPDTLDWVLAEEPPAEETRKPGRPSTASPLTEMFSPNVTNRKKLIEKIGDYLTKKHDQTDIAQLKIALDELHFLVSPVGVKSFRDALAGQYSPAIHIVHERGVQEAYSRLTNVIEARSKSIADMGKERIAIKELKDFMRR
jgi:hypothetical protein